MMKYSAETYVLVIADLVEASDIDKIYLRLSNDGSSTFDSEAVDYDLPDTCDTEAA